MVYKSYFIYLMMNKTNTVIYTGVTNNLVRRIYEHKHKSNNSFTSKYKVNKLVYYEIFGDVNEAIKREKQIKAGSRKKKIDLILKDNPRFDDLYNEIASP
jgi:putative endonuclease